MRIGVFTALYQQFDFEEALDKAVAAGVSAVEIGVGGYPGSQHCRVDDLLAGANERRAFLDAIQSRGLLLSALSVHNNPLHPDAAVARHHRARDDHRRADRRWRRACARPRQHGAAAGTAVPASRRGLHDPGHVGRPARPRAPA